MSNLYDNIQNLCARKGIRPGRLCTDLGISRSLMTDLKMIWEFLRLQESRKLETLHHPEWTTHRKSA